MSSEGDFCIGSNGEPSRFLAPGVPQPKNAKSGQCPVCMREYNLRDGMIPPHEKRTSWAEPPGS